jgi:hypothetical protein
VVQHAERVLFDEAHDVSIPDPVPANPSEAIDRRRHWAPAGYYALPSYDRKGRQVLVPTKVADFTVEDTEVDDVQDWATLGDFDELLERIPDLLAERNRQPPRHGLLGFMYRSHRGPLRIDVVKFDGDKRLPFWFAEVTVRLPRWEPKTGNVVFAKDAVRPAGTFAFRSIGGGGATEARRILDEHLRERVLPVLLKSVPSDVEPHEIETKFAEVSNRLFNTLRRTHATVHFAELRLPMGGIPVLLLLHGSRPPGGTLEIMPVTDWVPAPRRTTRDGTGSGAGSKKGVLNRSILLRAQTKAGDGRIDPNFKPLFPSELSWEPFEGEPSVDDLGDDGKILRALMERTAERLAIANWKPYAGRFLINASIVMGGRASAVQADAVGQPVMPALLAVTVVAMGGNLGKSHFTPQPSRAMAIYKYIVATASWVNLLYDAVKRVFSSGAHADRLHGLVAGRDHWLRHVREEYWPSLINSCGWIFVYGCQANMLQLLAASKRAIERRWEQRVAYADFFYHAVVAQVASAGELARLRDGLKGAIAKTPPGQKVSAQDVVLAERGGAKPASLNVHAAARSDLDRLLRHAPPTRQAGSSEGDITYKDGQPAILDRQAKPWTLRDLDLVIQVRQSSALALDPVLNHFLHEHTFADVQHYTQAASREALFALLQTMLDKNKETADETIDDLTYAFEKGKIVELSEINDAQYIPKNQVAGFDLQGIHLIVWQQLASERGRDDTLERAIDALFSRELGFRSIKAFSEFVGITALAVVCPPLAEAVGVAQAIHGVYEAHKLEGFYQSFIDPEQLLAWSDVRAEQFAAAIGLALALLPNGGRIVRAAFPRSRALLESGLKKGLRSKVLRELADILADVARFLKKDLATEFLFGLGANYVMSLAIEQMMAPLVHEVATRAAQLPPEQR